MICSLSVHAQYGCRDAGACCTAGWPIPIEAAAAATVGAAVADGRLRVSGIAAARNWLDYAAGAPVGSAGILRTRPGGACVFHDGDARRCVVHRDAGEGGLPLACRQFPRIVLTDVRGTFVTLSHYCPTAASLLFEATPLAIVPSPPAFPADAAFDALDARGDLPPLLHDEVLMDAEAYAAWESWLVGELAHDGGIAEEVLGRAAVVVEDVRSWRPGGESLAARIRRAGTDARDSGLPVADCGLIAESRSGGDPISATRNPQWDELWWYERVLEAVPAGVARPGLPADLADALHRWVDPAWRDWSAVIARYVAAHAFANWTAYQGRGLRAVWRSIAAALMVLRVESARQAASAGRVLDRLGLLEAVRQSDLLLRHLADPQALADRWNAVEDHPIAGCGMRNAD